MGNATNYLEGKKVEHRKLDTQIAKLEEHSLSTNDLEIRRMKLQRLRLKEEIDRLTKPQADVATQTA